MIRKNPEVLWVEDTIKNVYRAQVRWPNGNIQVIAEVPRVKKIDYEMVMQAYENLIDLPGITYDD